MTQPTQPRRFKAIESSKVLVVEGTDEEKLAVALLHNLNLPDVQVFNAEGQDRLGWTLQSLVRDPRFVDGSVTCLGIIRDADDNPVGKLQSTQGMLRNGGPDIERSIPVPAAAETVEVSGPLKVSIWLSPGDGRVGMLEDLFVKTLEEQPLHQAAHDFVEAVSGIYPYQEALPRGTLAVSRNRQKSMAHACLIATGRPLQRIGEAAQTGHWSLDHSAMQGLRRFLLALFGTASSTARSDQES